MNNYTKKKTNEYGTFYYNDKEELHRTDGPAVEFASYKAWYLDGKRHRTDGPAVESAGGYKEWYVDGEELTEKEFNERASTTKTYVAVKQWRELATTAERLARETQDLADSIRNMLDEVEEFCNRVEEFCNRVAAE
jgi:hypothetical protein